jgi:hypothetical protein
MDFMQEDIDRIAADQATRIQEERMEEEELRLALSVSQSTAEADARRRAFERRMEEYNETRLALSASRLEDEQVTLRHIAAAEAEACDLEAARRQEEDDMAAAARKESEREAAARRWEEEQLERAMVASRAEDGPKAFREAEVLSWKAEQRRLQAAREEEEAFNKALIANRIAAERQQKKTKEQLAQGMCAHQASVARLVESTAALSLQTAYAVNGLSEGEQLQFALSQSQEVEDTAQAAEVERV